MLSFVACEVDIVGINVLLYVGWIGSDVVDMMIAVVVVDKVVIVVEVGVY